MNYMAEIKAFYNLVQVKQLSTGQIALWHALMHINNTCAWIEWFTVPNLTLELNTGLSRSGIYKARNVLKQHGIIDFKPNGTKATSYKMISLLKSNQDSNQIHVPMQDSNQISNQDGKQGSTQDGNQDSNQISNTLNKQYNTKQDKINNNSTTEQKNIFDEEFSELAKLYQQVIGEPNALTADWIVALKSEYGFEWTKNAMLESEKQGKRSKKYVEGILRNWKVGGGMKLSTDQDRKQPVQAKKTKFHNFKQRSDKYTADELEAVAERKRQEYLDKLKKQSEAL